jgi:hypothetical protein
VGVVEGEAAYGEWGEGAEGPAEGDGGDASDDQRAGWFRWVETYPHEAVAQTRQAIARLCNQTEFTKFTSFRDVPC